MNANKKRQLIWLLTAIAVTVAALALLGQDDIWARRSGAGVAPPDPAGSLSVSGRLVQDKIRAGSEGVVTMALTLAADGATPPHGRRADVDLTIILDTSGSMRGRSLQDARRAVTSLLRELTPTDRLALVTYATDARLHSDLLPLTEENRAALITAVQRISAGGATNLGAGLHMGMQVMAGAQDSNRHRRAILISDGMANRGIINAQALGGMASTSAASGFSVSTVGVGRDFNEQLLATVADHGAGSYTYLEDPNQFVAAFTREYRDVRQTAADAVQVMVPLADGVRLLDAGGYPVRQTEGMAVFSPGSLRFGQRRTLFLTFRIPSDRLRRYTLDGIQVRYRQDDRSLVARLNGRHIVACIEDEAAVVASVKKDLWSDQVVQEDFNRLKEQVAADIRKGRQEAAIGRIDRYREEKEAINAVVGSETVAQNLSQDTQRLQEMVTDTFSGAPGAVASKQQANAKALQYEGYRGRRAK